MAAALGSLGSAAAGRCPETLNSGQHGRGHPAPCLCQSPAWELTLAPMSSHIGCKLFFVISAGARLVMGLKGNRSTLSQDKPCEQSCPWFSGCNSPSSPGWISYVCRGHRCWESHLYANGGELTLALSLLQPQSPLPPPPELLPLVSSLSPACLPCFLPSCTALAPRDVSQGLNPEGAEGASRQPPLPLHSVVVHPLCRLLPAFLRGLSRGRGPQTRWWVDPSVPCTDCVAGPGRHAVPSGVTQCGRGDVTGTLSCKWFSLRVGSIWSRCCQS